MLWFIAKCSSLCLFLKGLITQCTRCSRDVLTHKGLQNTVGEKTSEGRLIVHDTLGRWEEGTLCVNCAQLAFPATPLFAQFRNLSCPPASCHGWQGHAPCQGLPWSPCHHGRVVPVFPNLQVSSASNTKVTEFPKSLRIRQELNKGGITKQAYNQYHLP